MAASGFAGLGYQVVWTQQTALWLGHEAAAVLAVVAAFFGGLGVGALLMGPSIERSAHPLRWYAGCESAIAVWALALVLLREPASRALLHTVGAQAVPGWQWAVAFGGSFLLLLPATAAMGATLPAMVRVTAQLHRQLQAKVPAKVQAKVQAQGRAIATLYAANTLGAVIGVLACAFWLVPTFGLARTAGVCIALNLLCATAALAALRPQAPAAQSPTTGGAPALHPDLLPLAATGLLGIGYEVVVARVLGQVTEDTVYTFALLLAVYLVGTALGAASYGRWRARVADPDRLDEPLLGALALACLVGTASLWAAQRVRAEWFEALGGDMAAALGAETSLALMAFALPTFVMGALFSHLSASASARGGSFGRSLGSNTLGAAAAPAVFGVLITPLLGPKWALLLIAIGYLALSARRAWSTPVVWVPLGVAAALAAWAPPLAFVDIPEGGHIVSYEEGSMAAVSVVEDAAGVARLRINNRQQEGSSSSLWADARQALLPLWLHPAPRRALFLGLGTGMTAGSAAEDPTLQVDAVELLPEVIAASRHFTRVMREGAPNPRLHVMAADARRYVRTAPQTYDVIVADNFHPARGGSGALYTAEHFQAVRGRLVAGGIFCQWLPLHQLDLQTLRSIVQSFVTVYPGARALLASNSLETPVLGLVGQVDGMRWDARRLQERLARSALPKSPAEFGIDDGLALLGSFVAGPRALQRFAGGAPANTDDHPVVAYLAPRITYAPDSRPRDRLLALLRELFIEPADVLVATAEPAWARRLAAYWAARDLFVESGKDVRPTHDVQDMLSRVREPLLSVLRISPDFRPAYDPLLRMAAALEPTDMAAARALRAELIKVQPARPEAGLALHQ